MSGRGKRLPSSPRRPNKLWDHQANWGLCYLGMRRPGLEVYHKYSSGAEVKNVWSYTSAPPVCLRGLRRDKIPLTLTLLEVSSVWLFESSEVWYRAAGRLVPDVSKGRIAFVIKVLSQKTLISSSSVVTSPNLVRCIKTHCQLSNLSGVSLRNIELAKVDLKLVCTGRKSEVWTGSGS
jgi:hypothetical protein